MNCCRSTRWTVLEFSRLIHRRDSMWVVMNAVHTGFLFSTSESVTVLESSCLLLEVSPQHRGLKPNTVRVSIMKNSNGVLEVVIDDDAVAT